MSIQNVKYQTEDVASIFNLKEHVNKFFVDLSNTQVYNYLSNGSFNKFWYTNHNLKSWNIVNSVCTSADYNLDRKWLKSKINSNGYLSQELSNYLKPNTEYTIVLYASSNISGMNLEVSASNSNQIKNLDDLTQNDYIRTGITQNQFMNSVYKHKLNFRTSSSFSASGSSIKLKIINSSGASGICLLQTICMYQGSIELDYIDKTSEFSYVVDDTAPADPDILWSSNKISNDSVAVSGNIVKYVVPPGTIMTFASSSAPEGFLYTDGSSLSKTAYSNLYSVIGDIFTPTNKLINSSSISSISNNMGLDYDNNGFLYVANHQATPSGSIIKYNINTGVSATSYQYNSPFCIKVDRQTGNFFACNGIENVINKYTTSWETLNYTSYGVIQNPQYLFIQGNYLYVSDTVSGNIVKLDIYCPNTLDAYISKISIPNLKGPFVLDSNGNYYISIIGSDIKKYNSKGSFLYSIPWTKSIDDISIDSNDDLYITSSSNGVDRYISKVSSNGVTIFEKLFINTVFGGIVCRNDTIIYTQPADVNIYIDNVINDPSYPYFNIMDLRGKFIRSWDNTNSIDINRKFGSYQLDTIKSHIHITGQFTAPSNDDISLIYENGFSDSNKYLLRTVAGATGNSSVSPPTTLNNNLSTITTPDISISGDNRPKNIALLTCIKY